MSWNTGLYTLFGVCTFLLWGFWTLPSFVIGLVTYGICSYYAYKWEIPEKFPCVMASIMWLGTLIFWIKIYRINENAAKLRLVEKIMES